MIAAAQTPLSELPPPILVMAGVSLVALLVAIFALAQVNHIRRKFRALLVSSQGNNLEGLLIEHLRERESDQEIARGTRKRVGQLEAQLQLSKRHIGLVKYDAFDDVGGNQSFALALIDDDGNGVVINSVVGRMDCRVYAKPILKGASERTLSQEEERAIRDAMERGPKSIVS